MNRKNHNQCFAEHQYVKTKKLIHLFQVLNDTFPDHTFLMNGLIVGIKGLLSFLSAPLIGALSDSLGRKFFLLITVAFTCAPIPLMIINTWFVANLRTLLPPIKVIKYV